MATDSKQMNIDLMDLLRQAPDQEAYNAIRDVAADSRLSDFLLSPMLQAYRIGERWDLRTYRSEYRHKLHEAVMSSRDALHFVALVKSVVTPFIKSVYDDHNEASLLLVSLSDKDAIKAQEKIVQRTLNACHDLERLSGLTLDYMRGVFLHEARMSSGAPEILRLMKTRLQYLFALAKSKAEGDVKAGDCLVAHKRVIETCSSSFQMGIVDGAFCRGSDGVAKVMPSLEGLPMLDDLIPQPY